MRTIRRPRNEGNEVGGPEKGRPSEMGEDEAREISRQIALLFKKIEDSFPANSPEEEDSITTWKDLYDTLNQIKANWDRLSQAHRKKNFDRKFCEKITGLIKIYNASDKSATRISPEKRREIQQLLHPPRVSPEEGMRRLAELDIDLD
jgi:hypothetical protein